MQGKVAEWRKGDVTLAGILRSGSRLCHDMASLTPDILKDMSPPGRQSGIRHRDRRCRETHECSKIDNIRRIIRGGNTAVESVRHIGAIFRQQVVLATRIG